ncbi:unnamed protein product [Vicia faba]|uniref:Uncharacterized protein n=1 Tax=Vicia faba TaxID=3906 RepID=A0AAV1ARC8_VICFA|nr:unnamed protein product [Vicia faba]
MPPSTPSPRNSNEGYSTGASIFPTNAHSNVNQATSVHRCYTPNFIQIPTQQFQNISYEILEQRKKEISLLSEPNCGYQTGSATAHRTTANPGSAALPYVRVDQHFHQGRVRFGFKKKNSVVERERGYLYL